MGERGHPPPGEFERIRRIVERLPVVGGEPRIGPGDDCAAFDGPGGRLILVTVDALVEDVHFTRRDTSPASLGRRLAGVNLSDVAAMGGEPRWAVLSVAVPGELAEAWIERIALGAAEELARFDARMIGGNLARSASHVFADLTLIGEVEGECVLLRSGARPGDRVFVTGCLGAAAAGLAVAGGALAGLDPCVASELRTAHRHPEPRIREGRALALGGGVSAAIDVSDGLAQDAGHLAEASGVDVELRLDRLPMSGALLHAAQHAGHDASAWAATGGEDYELLFTAASDAGADVARRVERETGTSVTEIGRVAALRGEQPAVRWVDRDGRHIDGPQAGWDHFADGPGSDGS